jgi:hypothetical protein
MATQTVGDLTFTGTLEVSVHGSLHPGDNFLRTKKRHDRSVYGIISETEQLWISTPVIHFRGVVEGEGASDLSAWKVTFLQSISHAHWVGHYANGQEVRYRLNTDNGLLKDGKDDTLYYHGAVPLKVRGDSPVRRSVVNTEDFPVMSFWGTYSGDPSRPDGPGAEGNHLVRTSGLSRFRMFLAVVNEAAKQIVTLAECEWVVNWDGKYDHASGDWRPTSFPEMLAHEPVNDAAALYFAPAPESVPFSLLLDAATQFFEIETPGGWVLSRNSLPDPECKDRPTKRRWGDPIKSVE